MGQPAQNGPPGGPEDHVVRRDGSVHQAELVKIGNRCRQCGQEAGALLEWQPTGLGQRGTVDMRRKQDRPHSVTVEADQLDDAGMARCL